MGRIQDWVYALDAGVGTAGQAFNLGTYLADQGLRNPVRVASEVYQLGNNGYQLYQGLRNSGGVRGMADRPELYETGAMIRNGIGALGSAYDLTRLPDRIDNVRRLNRRERSNVRKALSVGGLVAGAVGDALNVAETGLRISRRFGADF